MFLLNFGDRFAGHHGGWWFLGGLIPLILFLVLIGVGVWALLRVTGRGPARPVAAAAAGPIARPDPALEELRLRYARGELTREEFMTRSRDLRGFEPNGGAPPPSGDE